MPEEVDELHRRNFKIACEGLGVPECAPIPLGDDYLDQHSDSRRDRALKLAGLQTRRQVGADAWAEYRDWDALRRRRFRSGLGVLPPAARPADKLPLGRRPRSWRRFEAQRLADEGLRYGSRPPT